MATKGGYIEIITSNQTNPVFTNVIKNDMVIYTENPSQTIHFGVNSYANQKSAMSLTSNALNIAGDITTNGQLKLSGIRIDKRSAANEVMNVSGIITGATLLTSNLQTLTNSLALRFTEPSTNRLDILDISSNQLFSVSQSGIVSVKNTDSVSTPGYTWLNNTSTGMYRITSNEIGFACGGVQSAKIAQSGITANKFIGSNDSSLNPTFTWSNNTTSGIYMQSSNQIGISCDGVPALLINAQSNQAPAFNATGNNGIQTNGVTRISANGVLQNVTIDPSLIIEGISSNIAFSGTGDIIRQNNPIITNLTVNGLTTTQNIQASRVLNLNDSATTPSYTWITDSDTGMYRAADNTIGFTCGGSNVMTLSNNTATFSNVTISRNLSVPNYEWKKLNHTKPTNTASLTIAWTGSVTISSLATFGFITYNPNVDGDSFTINRNGIYTITSMISNGFNTGPSTLWIDKNESITTNYATANVLVMNTKNAALYETGVSWTGYLSANDVIRVKMTNTQSLSANMAYVYFGLIFPCS